MIYFIIIIFLIHKDLRNYKWRKASTVLEINVIFGSNGVEAIRGQILDYVRNLLKYFKWNKKRKLSSCNSAFVWSYSNGIEKTCNYICLFGLVGDLFMVKMKGKAESEVESES